MSAQPFEKIAFWIFFIVGLILGWFIFVLKQTQVTIFLAIWFFAFLAWVGWKIIRKD